MEAFLCGPDEAVLPVGVTNLNNGSYELTMAANRPGDWTIKPWVSYSFQLYIAPSLFYLHLSGFQQLTKHRSQPAIYLRPRHQAHKRGQLWLTQSGMCFVGHNYWVCMSPESMAAAVSDLRGSGSQAPELCR